MSSQDGGSPPNGGPRHTRKRERSRDTADAEEGEAHRHQLDVSPSKRAAIAPVVRLLGAVSSRVHAAWSRIGVSDPDRQGRWATFLEESLAPYIEDFLTVNEAEERNLAAGNDQLLRDVVFLCERLEETSTDAALAGVIAAIRDGCRRRRRGEAEGEQPCTTAAEGGEGSGTDDDAHDQLLMPGMTSFFLPTPAKAERGAAPVAATDHGAEEEDRGDDDGGQRIHSATAAAIRSAIRNLSANTTHQKVQVLLQSEYGRLERLAEERIRLLCILYKHRALLDRPAAEQAAVRARYVSKLSQPHETPSANDSGGSAVAPSPPAPASSSAAASSGDDDAELRLFMEASLVADSMDLRGTSFCLRPRPTCAPATPAADAVAGASSPSTVEVSASTRATIVAGEQPSGRATVFDLDTGDVTQFGKRQDLSLRRINAEANDILSRIAEENGSMRREAALEWAAAEALLRSHNTEAGPERDSAPVPYQLHDVQKRFQALQDAFEAEEKAAMAAATATTAATAAGERSAGDTTRPTSVFTEDARGGGARLAPSSQLETLYPAVRRVLQAVSFAPALCFVQGVRRELQRHLWHRRRAAAHAAMARRREAQEAYAAATGDPAYGAAPDFTEWVRAHDGFEVPTVGTLAAAEKALQQHVAAADALMAALDDETAVLRGRLDLIRRAEPLLAARAAILAEQRDLQEGSRERLLSKRVNMAKQLLHEETVRRRIAKELPRVVAQLTEMADAWDALVAGEAGDGADGAAGRPQLCVGGQSVREVLQQHGTEAAGGSAGGASLRSGGGGRFGAGSSSRSRTPPPRQQRQQQQPSAGRRAAAPTAAAQIPKPRSVSPTPQRPATSQPSSQQQRDRPHRVALSTSRARQSPTPLVKGRNPVLQRARAAADLQSRAKGVFSRLSPSPPPQPHNRGNSHTSGAVAANGGAGARRPGGGLTARTASRSNTQPTALKAVAGAEARRAASAFPGPARYQSSVGKAASGAAVGAEPLPAPPSATGSREVATSLARDMDEATVDASSAAP